MELGEVPARELSTCHTSMMDIVMVALVDITRTYQYELQNVFANHMAHGHVRLVGISEDSEVVCERVDPHVDL